MNLACKICGCNVLDKLDFPNIDPDWWRCAACGCDTNCGELRTDYTGYESRRHDQDQEKHLERELTYNLDLFRLHCGPGNGRRFLDVGSCEGTAIRLMRRDGWHVNGFDVAKLSDDPEILIAPRFTADLFRDRFDAIMCREVIEHTPDPLDTFGELVTALAPAGVLQVQTPRPCVYGSKTAYQTYHVAVLSPLVIDQWRVAAGLGVLDCLLFDAGQCWTFRKPL